MPEYAADGTTATVPVGCPSATAATPATPLANATASPPSSAPTACSNERTVSVPWWRE